MFLHKNLFFFSIYSVISIPIMIIGIIGGYFPAICRVCFVLISLRLKHLKVDEGLLRDKIARYDHFMSYIFRYYKHKHAK